MALGFMRRYSVVLRCASACLAIGMVAAGCVKAPPPNAAITDVSELQR